MSGRVAQRAHGTHNAFATELNRILNNPAKVWLVGMASHSRIGFVRGWLDGTVIPTGKKIHEICKAMYLSETKEAELRFLAESDRSERARARAIREARRDSRAYAIRGARRA